jgi:hypothetical protein
MNAKFTVNGKTYETLESMPPDVKRLYAEVLARGGPSLADRDGNGIPDVLEGKGGSIARATVDCRIVVNGRRYGSVDEMSADDRRLYENALDLARAGGGPNVTVTRQSFGVTVGVPIGGRRPGAGASPSSRASGAIEPAGVESGIRAVLISIACLAAAAVVGWMLLRR